MAQLHQLLYGNSKKRMRVIMIDTEKKCENYMAARSHTTTGWHKIELAPVNSNPWRQKSATVGGNRCETVGRVGYGKAGWIGKNGFQEHT